MADDTEPEPHGVIAANDNRGPDGKRDEPDREMRWQLYEPSMKARMQDLERQKADIVARLSQAPADIPDVHPNVANVYRLRVDRFTEALDDPDGGRQAAEALRSLIGEIVLTPGKKRGEVHAELRGELFGILDFIKPEENQPGTKFMPAVAASPRNHRSLR